MDPDHPQRLRQQTILAKFGELALQSEDLDEILTEACRLVGQALGTDLAKVVELQSDGKTLLVRAGVGWKDGVVGVATINLEENTSEAYALRSGEPMISPDVAKETRFKYPDFLIDNGAQAVANVIIIGGKDRPAFGILQIDSRTPRYFSEEDVSFLRGYANLLAAAVDRLRVLHDLRGREALLTRALAQQQIAVSELHHRVKNNLQTVSSLLQMGRRNADASTRGQLDEITGRMDGLAAVQSHIYESIHLNEVDFTATLADIAASLIKIYHGGQASLVMPAAVPLVLDVARSMALSLVCYEVILSAMKYAWVDRSPGTLTIEITKVGSGHEIIIADDGVGFVEGDVEHGMGGRFSQALAEQASAQLALYTSPGSGTRVVITLC
ncbi:MAG: histidine kinase dimerization/phosphoacceptor domain -containing protein [Pseudomonadota bacterium]